MDRILGNAIVNNFLGLTQLYNAFEQLTGIHIYFET